MSHSSISNHPNPPLVRQVHPCVFYAKDLLTGGAKYAQYDPFIFSPTGDSNSTRHYANYSSKRPVISPIWIEKANKVIGPHSAKTTPATTPTAGGSQTPFLIKFSIPSLDYADEILRLADSYEARNTIPALITPVAKRRNRFGGGGFVAERYRIPLSLYSTAYLDEIESDHIDVLTSRGEISTFLPNNALAFSSIPKAMLASIHKVELEHGYGITINHFGHGDYNNASDIIPPMLFRQQYENAMLKFALPKNADVSNLSLDEEQPPPSRFSRYLKMVLSSSSNPTDSIPNTKDILDENADVCSIIPTQHPFLDNYINLPGSMKLQYSIPSTSYICTHAPTRDTITLFYQLLFEQKCKLVVGLTVCDPYWPFFDQDNNNNDSSDDENTNTAPNTQIKTTKLSTSDDQIGNQSVGVSTDSDDDTNNSSGLKPWTKVGCIERFGDFLITVDKIEYFDTCKYAIARHVTITHSPVYLDDTSDSNNGNTDHSDDNSNQTKHQCILLQYLDWPDMGVPDIHSFISFYQAYKLVQSRLYKENSHHIPIVDVLTDTPPVQSNTSQPDISATTSTTLHTPKNCVQVTTPVLVHCLAGIGRTGTFVLIDIIWSHLQSVFESINDYWTQSGIGFASKSKNEQRLFFSTLFNSRLLLYIIPYLLLCLRSARFQMVQTVAQLRFIAEFIEYYANCYLNSFILPK